MRREKLSDGSLALHFGLEDEAVSTQFEVLYDALMIYSERNVKYKDNWRRMGWRGTLIRIRERSERLWDEFWDSEHAHGPHEDDALDLINFAAFHIRALRGETTRDGSWW